MSQCYLYVIFALLLIYSHRTNATFYYRDKRTLEEDLRAEIPPKSLGQTISRSLSGPDSPLGGLMRNGSSGLVYTDTVCDKLYPNEKQMVCDVFMKFLILKEHGDVFESFVETDIRFRVPQIADTNDPFTCKEKSIETEHLNLEKRMFWCRPRHFRKTNTDDLGEIDGLFCAGSRRENTNRVFYFRPPQMDSQKVTPVGEMENYSIVARAMNRNR